MKSYLPKGITTNKRLPGRYIAQYWDTNSHHAKYIGNYSTIQGAVEARQSFIDNLTRFNGRVLPLNRAYPKGVKEIINKKKQNTYRSEIQFWYGKYKDKHVTIHVGTYETVEDAVRARIDFLDNLK